MSQSKRETVSEVLRALMLEDGDALALANRMMMLVAVGPLTAGLLLRRDERALGVAEAARRAAIAHGFIPPDAPGRAPIVFECGGTDLICGLTMAGAQNIAFCHAEDEQRGFVVVTTGAQAERCALSVPQYSDEPSDIPGVETVH